MGATPVEWANTSLEFVAEWGSGGTPSRKNSEYYQGGSVPWVKTGDLGPKFLESSSEFITEAAVLNSSTKYFPRGSVVIAMYGATIGRASILGFDGTTNQACGVGQPIAGITFSNFLYYFLLNEKDAFIAKAKGGAQPNISQTLIKEHGIALPALAEQKAIAQKLDTLLEKVETTKARLDRVPAILKRFRQSVLAAAVSGKLTKKWREVSGSTLDDWVITNVGMVAEVATGKTPKRTISEYWTNGSVPWLTSAATGKPFTYKAEQFVTEHAVERCTLKIFPAGTLLLAMYGEGKTRGQVTETMIGATCNQACAAVLADTSKINLNYLKIRLEENYEETRKSAAGGAQPNLNLSKVRDIPINLPPFEEQIQIVEQVERLFSHVAVLEKQAQAAQERVNALKQSILAKAFRGELTEAWRAANPELIQGDNSAEVLLETIKNEREGLTIKRKIGKKL